MILTRVIPCMDIRDGRIVKGVRFQGLRDAGDPVAAARVYEDQGADELVLLDVSATPEGRGHALETVRAVRRVLGIPLTVGGGVRTAEDAAALLQAGADKVGVNSAAVARPELLSELRERFGAQCVVIAIDAARIVPPTAALSGRCSDSQDAPEQSSTDRSEPRSVARLNSSLLGTWQVVVRSGTARLDIDAVEWAARATALGAGEVLLTSWDRDGTQAGYDLPLLSAVSRAVRVPVIASGGAANPGHLVEAIQAGADAVLAASIFHDGTYTVAQVKAALAKAGVEVRT